MEILYYNYKHFFTIWFPEIIYAKPTLELQTEDYKRFQNKNNNIKTKLIQYIHFNGWEQSYINCFRLGVYNKLHYN